MALAQFRKVHSKNGSGRFVVSEGVAPSEYLLPHPALPTLYTDIEDDRFEIVITKGTLLSVVEGPDGESWVVPANGDDTNLVLYRPGTAPVVGTYDAGGGGTVTPAGGGDPVTGVDAIEDKVIVPAETTIIGAAQYDLYRPFDKGTSQGSGWITHGYVEWPLVDYLNDDLEPGDIVVADALGRPVQGNGDEDFRLIAGKVVVTEKFAENFDDGLLSYMQLPSDPGAVREVYSLTQDGTYQGRLGIRANLDVAGVEGAVRVNLTI